MLVRILVIVIVVGALGYGLLKAAPFLAGPAITLTSPDDGARAPEGIVIVSGVASRAESLLVNGRTVLMHEDGAFETTLVLPRGSAILSITATDRFGRTITKRVTAFVP